MKRRLYTLVSLILMGAPVFAAPVVTLGPPVADGFSTVDPGSIQVDMLGAGDVVDLQVSITVHPLCIRPIDFGLATTGDGGTFTDLTGVVVNGCGGQTSVFDIRLTGDGIGHAFDIQFIDLDTGVPLASISVALFSGTAPVVTLGPPAGNSFSTVDPGSIRIDMFGDGDVVDLQVSITVHPFCIRPIDFGLVATGDGGTFSDLTGLVVNSCGGDTSVFDIRLTGDGGGHAFDIQFVDLDTGDPIMSIPVALSPGPAPIVTFGPPVQGDFLTVDPGSIRVEMLGAGSFIDLQLSLTVHPLCFVPIDVGLGAIGDGGTFMDLSGALVNECGGDTTVFDFRLTGDGGAHGFDIDIFDLNGGSPLASIPVEVFPGVFDTDGDRISDLVDNCVLVANLDQRDTDADDIGNICDPDVALPNDCRVNFLDLDVYRANFFQAGDLDTDNNGDGQTNFLDLDIVRDFFFGQPGPSASGCN